MKKNVEIVKLVRFFSLPMIAALSFQLAWALPGPSPIPMQVVKSSAPSRHIKVINSQAPGQATDIAANLVPGKTNIVVFFADW